MFSCVQSIVSPLCPCVSLSYLLSCSLNVYLICSHVSVCLRVHVVKLCYHVSPGFLFYFESLVSMFSVFSSWRDVHVCQLFPRCFHFPHCLLCIYVLCVQCWVVCSSSRRRVSASCSCLVSHCCMNLFSFMFLSLVTEFSFVFLYQPP